jgi:transposase-like protein
MVFPTNAPEGERLKFTSTILPPYLRRAKSIEELLPWLYLKGISTGDFSKALAALLGPDAPGLSASTITRLKADWWDDYERWSKRDLSARNYVYFAARSFGSGQTASVSAPEWTRIVNVCW